VIQIVRDEITIEISLENLLALDDLCGRSWFTRLWVLQEIFFASKASLLLCGQKSIQWRQARVALCVLRSGTFVCPYNDDFIKWDAVLRSIKLRTVLLQPLCERSMHDRGEYYKVDFLMVLEETKLSQCTDVRDRIYALLSLVPPSQLSMKPDYTLGPHQTFRTMVHKLLDMSPDPVFLRLCELKTTFSDMPSWVPDLESLPNRLRPESVQRCGSLLERPKIVGDIWHVVGKHISIVSRVYQGHRSPSIFLRDNEAKALLSRIISKIEVRRSPPRLQELLTTLIARQFAEAYSPPRPEFLSRSVVEEHLECFMSGTAEHSSCSQYIDIASDYLHNSSVFLDTEGFFGLGPYSSIPGDVLVVIVGCVSPMILRPQPDSNTYLVVGEAYHHRYHHREAILGPLPQNYEPILNDKFYLNYRNLETGDMQTNDPRLEQHPDGWVMHDGSLYNNQHQIFIHGKSSRRKFSHLFDPRTTPEELRKRGVDLQEFRLA
jgi:hypothetical protein